MTGSHVGSLKNISGVLFLREKEPLGVTNENPKKIVERAKVRHREFWTKICDDFVEKGIARRREKNVIHIEE